MLKIILVAMFCGIWLAECTDIDSHYQSDKERSIHIKINGKPVYRNVAYSVGKLVELSCVPPMENNPEPYTSLAIYRGKGENRENEPYCVASAPEPNCGFAQLTNVPLLWMKVNRTGNFTCQYANEPEPAAIPAQVTVYFEDGGSIQVYNDENSVIPLSEVGRITNSSSPRFVCPGEQQDSSVIWYRNEIPLKTDHNYEVNSTNYNLTFKSKGAKSVDGGRFGGWYRCERIDLDGKTLLARAFFNIKSNAYAAPVKKAYTSMETESVTMACEIEGEPMPSVQWERRENGNSVALVEIPDRISFGIYNGVPNASVTIQHLVDSDYRDYVCIANMGSSHAESVILLRVRSKLAALWPFLAIVTEVLILVTIIFLYEKRRIKKERQEAEQNAEQKKSLTAANNGTKDVRHRKT